MQNFKKYLYIYLVLLAIAVSLNIYSYYGILLQCPPPSNNSHSLCGAEFILEFALTIVIFIPYTVWIVTLGFCLARGLDNPRKKAKIMKWLSIGTLVIFYLFVFLNK